MTAPALETIIAAAVQYGATISLPPPARHGTILTTMSTQMHLDAMVPPFCQGFITSAGRFVNRIEAFEVAWRAGQLDETKKGPELFSEDLW